MTLFKLVLLLGSLGLIGYVVWCLVCLYRIDRDSRAFRARERAMQTRHDAMALALLRQGLDLEQRISQEEEG